MRNRKHLKERLKDGEVVIGTWCILPSTSVVNVIGSSGFDFVIIDMEHGPHTFQTVEEMIRAAEVENCTPLVRVAQNNEALILNALDIGSHGVVVPHIESKLDAQAAVSYAKYYPLGKRGFSPFTRAGRYSLDNVKNHGRLQNEKTLVTLMLEGKEGVENLEEILAIQGIKNKMDVIYIGVYDLSQSLGIPGQIDHPKVRKCLADCIKKIRSRGISAGGYVAKNKKDIAWMSDMGMQFITVLPDSAVIFQAFKSIYSDFCKIKPHL